MSFPIPLAKLFLDFALVTIDNQDYNAFNMSFQGLSNVSNTINA